MHMQAIYTYRWIICVRRSSFLGGYTKYTFPEDMQQTDLLKDLAKDMNEIDVH